MAVPKRKKSTSKRGMRRAHQNHKPMQFAGKEGVSLSHHVDPITGMYNGKLVIVTKAAKREQKLSTEE